MKQKDEIIVLYSKYQTFGIVLWQTSCRHILFAVTEPQYELQGVGVLPLLALLLHFSMSQ